ncbi:MAG: HD domain-containing protein [Vicinamibacteria bacterium]|jgi:putative hydrolase of HD superfamily|nr:HD domain-containing protein [Vicinamibacteria bacterium]
MPMDRLRRQIAFLIEIDQLKSVLRRNLIADGSRVENDAEHSWYFAMAALVLSETAPASIDLARILKMALIHDIVEVDVGDTFIYDSAARVGQAEREEQAARRLFGLLPEDQAAEFMGLWHEFEEAQTPEARFARAIDRLSAVILNYASGGRSWRTHGVSKEQILAVNARIAQGSPILWDFVRDLIEDAARRGYIDR